MATLVLTVIGDDQSGLVEALSAVVAEHDGNWDTSRMARLAGKFAGIVMVTVPDWAADALIDDLTPLEAEGLLEITVERASADSERDESAHYAMEIFGMDRPGIVHEVSHALAQRDINIDELSTETKPAAMDGGTIFQAHATLRIPASVSLPDLQDALGHISEELDVDIELKAEHS